MFPAGFFKTFFASRMPGERGQDEKQAKACDQAEIQSEALTKANLIHFRFVYNPAEESMNFSGEDRISRKMNKHFEENGLLSQWLGEVLMETPPGGMVNHFSSRKEKTTSLQKIFNTSLPPLPYASSELKNFEAVKSHFSKMMAVELQGLKFKWGDAPPNKIKEWLPEEDEALFKLLKAQAVNSPQRNGLQNHQFLLQIHDRALLCQEGR